MEQETQTTHKRRVHYKGKYPKKFEEKYKELQPEKYQDTIAACDRERAIHRRACTFPLW